MSKSKLITYLTHIKKFESKILKTKYQILCNQWRVKLRVKEKEKKVRRTNEYIELQ